MALVRETTRYPPCVARPSGGDPCMEIQDFGPPTWIRGP